MSEGIEITEDLIECFLDEAVENLARLNDLLMALEHRAEETGLLEFAESPLREQINEVFRAAHSLKGLAAAFGFDAIRDLTHEMESVFDEARHGRMPLDAASIDVMLQSVDRLEELCSSYLANEGDLDASEEVAAVRSLRAAQAPAAQEAVRSAKEPPAAERSRESNAIGELLMDPELRRVFLETSEEACEQLDGALLALEEDAASQEALNEAFRIAHNLKSAFGSAEISDAAELTHRMESVFDLLRSAELQLDEPLMGELLTVADRVREVVEMLRDERYQSWPAERVHSLFRAQLGLEETEPVTPRPVARSAPEVPAITEGGFVLKLQFSEENADADLQAFMLLNKCRDVGDVVFCEPDLEAGSLEPGARLTVGIQLQGADESQRQSIQETLALFPLASCEVDLVVGETVHGPMEDQGTVRGGPTPGSIAASESRGAAPSVPEIAATSIESSDSGVPSSAPTPHEVVDPRAAEDPQPKERKLGRTRAASSRSETIRVDVDRLDQLVNLGGELVIHRARLGNVERTLRELHAGRDLRFAASGIAARVEKLGISAKSLSIETGSRSADRIRSELSAISDDLHGFLRALDVQSVARSAVQDLGDTVGMIERISTALQRGIMETRMVPVGPLFGRFQRVVRDIAKGLDKQVRLELRGESTELDKRMIDELADPLTHMVRNAVDHGIESRDERVASGKDPVATVVMDAYQQGKNICVEVRDDGRGISVERVRKKIVDRGILPQSQVEALSDYEAIQYIFHPGFSTAEQVSEISGRGMGMDIVLMKIEGLNGSVEVDSRAGEGTRFVIRLPLTMAIATVVLVAIGEETYALPVETVSEILDVPQGRISTVQGRRVLRLRERMYSVLALHEVFPSEAPREQPEVGSELTLLVLNTGDTRVALAVDEMLGQEEVVIKSISETFTAPRGVAGATILGNGRVALILDAMQLVKNGVARADELEDCN